MLCFPRMHNPILTPPTLMFAGCLQHFKSKEKVLNIPKKWAAFEKGPSSFQNFHIILGKCNIITAELLTIKCHPPLRFHKWHKIKTEY